ncbi:MULTISPECIES: hypothetical protein [unclassified Caballeronia]|uniref:hypothetical protein n=1 Tax=unclassified Caballeronia TaxID=2646786 RepID=UPI002027FB85|nr:MULTISPECIES: hypothetical protein [unclassified Caballeronia]
MQVFADDGMRSADISPFNNKSADNTDEAARAAGAQVTDVPLHGKGNVVCTACSRTLPMST